MEYFSKRLTSKFRCKMHLNFDVNRFVKYSFSYGTSHMSLKFDVNVCNVPKLWMFYRFEEDFLSQNYSNCISVRLRSSLFHSTPHMWRSIGKRVLLKRLTSKFRYILYLNFDVKRFDKLLFLWNVTYKQQNTGLTYRIFL